MSSVSLFRKGLLGCCRHFLRRQSDGNICTEIRKLRKLHFLSESGKERYLDIYEVMKTAVAATWYHYVCSLQNSVWWLDMSSPEQFLSWDWCAYGPTDTRKESESRYPKDLSAHWVADRQAEIGDLKAHHWILNYLCYHNLCLKASLISTLTA